MIDERALRRDARRRDDPWGRVIIGLSIVAFGIIEWLDQLGRIDAHDYLHWWPLALVAFGVAHLVRGRWAGGIVWTMIGLVFMPRLPFFRSIELGYVLGLWPLLITVGGITLIRQALRPPRHGETFRALAWMGGNGRSFASADFGGGDAIAVMGGCAVNLTNATITSEAVVDVLAFWGGVELRIPPTWIVETHILPLLGGVTNRTSNPTEGDGPRLIVRGSAIMGGVELRNAPEAKA